MEIYHNLVKFYFLNNKKKYNINKYNYRNSSIKFIQKSNK